MQEHEPIFLIDFVLTSENSTQIIKYETEEVLLEDINSNILLFDMQMNMTLKEEVPVEDVDEEQEKKNKKKGKEKEVEKVEEKPLESEYMKLRVLENIN